MLILEPNTQFRIEFFRNNPSDTATYFVQSKIYNSLDKSLLATVNLTDEGSGYFSKLYTLPGDTFGNGRQITIISTCYTDLGYTTISPIYGAQLDQYIIRHLASQNLGGFTTQLGEAVKNAATDYEKIRTIMRELLEAAKPEAYNDSSIHSRLENLESSVREGFSRHDKSLSALEKSVHDKIDIKTGERADEVKEVVREGMKSLSPKFDELHSVIYSKGNESAQLHKKTHAHLESIVNDTSIHKKIDDSEKNSENRHAELLDALDQPINLTQAFVPQVRREKLRKKTEHEIKSEERDGTIKKLITL